MENSASVESFSKDFNLMVIGQIVSILGATLLRFALSLYVLDITGRADVFATLYAISSIPLLLSPLGGAIADRFNRRNLMVIYDLISSAVILFFIFVLSVGTVSMIFIGIIMVLLTLISALYSPVVMASIPLLVTEKKLEQANGIVNGVQALSNVAAPVLGGMLYSIVGLKTLVVISCITFFLSAILETFIKIPFMKRKQDGHIVSTIIKDMKIGFTYVVKESYILKSMILAALLNLILTPLFVVGGPIILRVTMKSSDTLYGIGMGLIDLATILGALSIGFFAKKMKMNTIYQWLLMIALLIIPMSTSIMPLVLRFGYYPSFILFIVCAILIAVAMTIISIFVITVVQKKTPNENLGKVMAIITAVAQCMAPIGQAIYGIMFEAFNIKVYLPTLFVSLIMIVIAILTKRLLRNESETA
ncbi:MFS transporter [Bacillus pseudomycoides]|uniref:MFS transporter n=1 Tax=Bacillus pseudomycoides TaxID=64104 RepID=UPI000BEB6064|nr:MFS transporter [Bacillus pseudomycoides]PEE41479.1 MFS transporter [Bacillus pseudomycoides]PEI90198.1 MFS transporter [Bacillus pseudomycoides]PGA87937.1 MFS transporter [Bacillus pseudomycoides]PHF39060.1 MFS transporter [Bacillus pseudomycoides]